MARNAQHEVHDELNPLRSNPLGADFPMHFTPIIPIYVRPEGFPGYMLFFYLFTFQVMFFYLKQFNNGAYLLFGYERQ